MKRLQVVFLLCLLAFTSVAWASIEYTYEDLGHVTGRAVNDSGVVVGVYTNSSTHNSQAFAYTTSLTDLGVLSGGSYSDARSINSAGAIVGFADNSSGSYHPVVWPVGGSITDVAPGSGGYSVGTINDNGLFGFEGGSWPYHTYLYNLGTSTTSTISAFGSDGALPRCINASGEMLISGGPSDTSLFVGTTDYSLPTLGGQLIGASINTLGVIVGSSQNSGGTWTHACAWYPDVPNATSGTIVDLGVLGTGTHADAEGVNAWGVIVGSSEFSSSGYTHGFRYKNGVMDDLNNLVTLPSGAVITDAPAVNNRWKEQIVCIVDCTDGTHTFRLTHN